MYIVSGGTRLVGAARADVSKMMFLVGYNTDASNPSGFSQCTGIYSLIHGAISMDPYSIWTNTYLDHHRAES